jgi:hypothetical protein
MPDKPKHPTVYVIPRLGRKGGWILQNYCQACKNFHLYSGGNGSAPEVGTVASLCDKPRSPYYQREIMLALPSIMYSKRKRVK